MTATESVRDQRLILLSIWASAGFAVLSSVWGIAIGSSMIIFDGLYSFVSIGLSVLAVLALRFTSRGADERFPWGREVAEPLVVVIKAATLGGLCIYAAVGGVQDLVDGGREVSAVSAVVYAVVATAGGLAVGLVLRRAARADRDGGQVSDLVRAEAAEWLGDTLLSAGVLVGFLGALGLVAAGRADLAAYVDPGMVVLVSLLFLRVPVKLIIGGMREVLSMSPPADVLDQLTSRVREVETRYGFAESFLRASKVGSRMDIEVDFVLDENSRAQTVAECDQARQDLHDRLADLGYERSVVITFTADRKWAR
ncbi:MAG TPA: cation diffusion facilitator family transporter [Microlunatus sp.]